jgi:hypothetical protein
MNQIFGGVKEVDKIDCVPTLWFWYHDFDGGDSTQDYYSVRNLGIYLPIYVRVVIATSFH